MNRIIVRFMKIFMLGGLAAIGTHIAEIKELLNPTWLPVAIPAVTALLAAIEKWLNTKLDPEFNKG